MASRRERGGGSDLASRIVVAVPAIIFALIIVHQGGEIWTAGIFALGVVAMGELYTLMGRVRPPALAGFLTLAAMLIAALYGEPRHVIMVLAAAGLFSGQTWARVVAVLFATLNAIAQIGLITAFPLFSILIIVLDVVVIYHLTVGWEPVTRTP